MKTPIKWAGSKKALLPILRQFWTGGKYIEPFCGSACLFFDLEPAAAILGDINAELILSYKAIRKSPKKIQAALERLPINKETYYRLRKVDPFSLEEHDLAARFLFLNRLCFNGIYRTNMKGQFNVPFAEPKNVVRFDYNSLKEAGRLLKKAVLMNADFEEVLDRAGEGDFVYLDPPYAVSSRRIFSEYHPKSFSEQDLKRLERALCSLDRRGSKFIISYADSVEGRRLASKWRSRRVRTRRNVAGFVGHRRAAYEVLASNVDLQ